MPLLARAVHTVLGGPIGAAFTGLSALFALGFWLLLWAPPLVETLSVRTLVIASALILATPGSFFFFDGMTESLVALLLLALVVLWRQERFPAVVPVLALATAAKQVFVPIAVALFGLRALAWRPRRPAVFALQALGAVAGFVLFGLYSWYAFGDFLMSTHYSTEAFRKQISLFNLVNLTHYARALPTFEGMVAFSSVVFLLATGLRLFGSVEQVRSLPERLRVTRSRDGLEIVLWTLASAYTAFCVLGNAMSEPPYPPFQSFLRFQTINTPLVLLLAASLGRFSNGQLAAFGIPLAWVGLYWQIDMTVRYWAWIWIS